jgi:hypothetical protein
MLTRNEQDEFEFIMKKIVIKMGCAAVILKWNIGHSDLLHIH